MGLDQYLYAKKYTSENFNNDGQFETLKKALGSDIVHLHPYSPSVSIEMKVAQWRKANEIHQWFVRNCQDSIDDCRLAYVGREKLEELLDLCKQVTADHSKAQELLPRQEGFFFGSTEYDQWYFLGLQETVSMLEKTLTLDGMEWEFYYSSSW